MMSYDDEGRRTEFTLDSALRVALRSTSRPQAALYLCRKVREAAFRHNNDWGLKTSMGLIWLSDNHEQFHELVPDATLFFRSLLDEKRCARQIIYDERLLGLMAPQNRESFIHDAIERDWTDHGWLNAARCAGLSENSLVSLLLRVIQIAAEGNESFLESFLLHGLSDPRYRWKWTILDGRQFYEAIHTCVAAKGDVLFHHAAVLLPRIAERVTPQEYAEIVGLAGGFIEDLRSTAVADLVLFPVDVQLKAVMPSSMLSPEVMAHIATLPGGHDAIVAYLRDWQQFNEERDMPTGELRVSTALHAPRAVPVCIDALQTLLHTGQLRNIEDVPTRVYF